MRFSQLKNFCLLAPQSKGYLSTFVTVPDIQSTEKLGHMIQV
jgi:hypothetical protein